MSIYGTTVQNVVNQVQFAFQNPKADLLYPDIYTQFFSYCNDYEANAYTSDKLIQTPIEQYISHKKDQTYEPN